MAQRWYRLVAITGIVVDGCHSFDQIVQLAKAIDVGLAACAGNCAADTA